MLSCIYRNNNVRYVLLLARVLHVPCIGYFLHHTTKLSSIDPLLLVRSFGEWIYLLLELRCRMYCCWWEAINRSITRTRPNENGCCCFHHDDDGKRTVETAKGWRKTVKGQKHNKYRRHQIVMMQQQTHSSLVSIKVVDGGKLCQILLTYQTRTAHFRLHLCFDTSLYNSLSICIHKL